MGDTDNKNKVGNGTADQTGVTDNGNTTGDANATNDTGSDNGGNNNNGSDNNDNNNDKTFTQKQVSTMMAREKKQGRDAAYRELGIDPNDTKSVSMFKAFIEAQKTDEQKANEEAVAQAAKVAEAEHRAMVAEAKAEAMQLGVLPQFADDAVTLALAKMDDTTDLKSIIGELKTKYPVWFDSTAAGADGKNATGQKGTGASINTGTKDNAGGENKGMGARLAAQRRTQIDSKKSFWS